MKVPKSKKKYGFRNWLRSWKKMRIKLGIKGDWDYKELQKGGK